MDAIKEYKPQTIVYYKNVDGSIDTLITDRANRDVLVSQLNNNKFVMVEGTLINVYNIQKIDDTKGDIEELYYSQPRVFRTYLDAKARKNNSINWFEYLSSLCQWKVNAMTDRLFSMIENYNTEFLSK